MTTQNTNAEVVTVNPPIEVLAVTTINDKGMTEKQKEVAELVRKGLPVDKELAKSMDKKWLKTIRANRREQLVAMSGAIIGQLGQEGFRVTNMSGVKTSERTGDQRINLTLVKKSESELDKANKMIADLRAQIGKLTAK